MTGDTSRLIRIPAMAALAASAAAIVVLGLYPWRRYGALPAILGVFFFLPLLLLAGCATPGLHQRSLDVVWQTVNQTHYDPTFGGRDWAAIGERHRATAIADAAAFRDVANAMLFELELSHLLAVRPEDMQRYLPETFAPGSTGIDVAWLDGEAVIRHVAPDSPAARAGLAPGMVIEAVVAEADGIRLPPFNERNRRNGMVRAVLARLYGAPGSETTLSLRGVGKAVLRRAGRGEGRRFSDALPPFFIEFEARQLEHGIGYVRFNHFAPPVGDLFRATLETLERAPGLIIDLRGNAGGFLRTLDRVAQSLMTSQALLYTLRLRDRNLGRTLAPASGAFAGPVAVLVDETSMSASELFAGSLQARGRVTVIGRRTPGYMLVANWRPLPNGFALMHTIGEPRTAAGTVLEDRGVIPDIPVPLDRESLAAGRDAQLEAAVRYIIEAVGKE